MFPGRAASGLDDRRARPGPASLPSPSPRRRPIAASPPPTGSAYAAWRVGSLIGDDELIAEDPAIASPLAVAISAAHDIGVIGGNAGAIPALLAMGRSKGLERCLDVAFLLGEELCRLDPACSGVRCIGADREPASELEEFTPSGLSHGAAGLGLALLELYAATLRREFRDAARRAFDYEDTLFEPERGNWADLRRPTGYSRHELARCNGAPGIALARLRASTLDPDREASYLGMARAGLASTLDTIEECLDTPRNDTTPCHGLAGLIEIVAIAGRMLDDASYRRRADDAARALIDRYSESGDRPSGLYSGGPNPSLMLGNAGVGYTFLRLHDPARVPSILRLGR